MAQGAPGSAPLFTRNLVADLEKCLSEFSGCRLFLLTDENVNRLWVDREPVWERFPRWVLPPGEEHKQLESVTAVWDFLGREGADRSSLLLNVGGGMVTDLGGFAASTFKRGLRFINLPTTLLAQVDASVGGKTGFNYNGLKNEIGTFALPRAVLIRPAFLRTLDISGFLSGFAEMIKHGLIHSPAHLEALKSCGPACRDDEETLTALIAESVAVKSHFIEADPGETGIRKALNFGHTVGHALESLALGRGQSLQHGYAVAWGMVAELFLSSLRTGYPQKETKEHARWIRQLYGEPPLEEKAYELLFERMLHDKKNESGRIRFTLLAATGRCLINQECSKSDIFRALDYLRTL